MFGEEGSREFPLIVQSDASKEFYPQNWSNNFTVRFPRPIVLHGEWEMALTEIHFPLQFEFHRDSPFHPIQVVEREHRKVVQKIKEKVWPPSHTFHPKQHWDRGDAHRLFEIPTNLIVTEHKKGHKTQYKNLWITPSLAESETMSPYGTGERRLHYRAYLHKYGLDHDGIDPILGTELEPYVDPAESSGSTS